MLMVQYGLHILRLLSCCSDGLMKDCNFSRGYEEYLLNSYIVGREIDYLEEFSRAFVDDYFSARNFNPWIADYKRQNDMAANITLNETNNNETGTK